MIRDRLLLHCARHRGIADQFDQLVSEDHLAWRDGDLDAWPKAFRASRRLAVHQTKQVVDEVACASDEIGAIFPKGLVDDLRVERTEIRGRDGVQDLPAVELDEALMPPGDSGKPGGRVVPPLLGKQEGLLHGVEGERLPGPVLEPSILRQGHDCWRSRPHSEPAAKKKIAQPRNLFDRFGRNLPLLAW